MNRFAMTSGQPGREPQYRGSNSSTATGNATSISDSPRNKCVLCWQPHSPPGNPRGTSRPIDEVAHLFRDSLDAFVPQKMFNYGDLWFCAKCEPKVTDMTRHWKAFKRVEEAFNTVRSRVAKIVVDSVDVEESPNSLACYPSNAFDLARAQIYRRWDGRLKVRTRSLNGVQSTEKQSPVTKTTNIETPSTLTLNRNISITATVAPSAPTTKVNVVQPAKPKTQPPPPVSSPKIVSNSDNKEVNTAPKKLIPRQPVPVAKAIENRTRTTSTESNDDGHPIIVAVESLSQKVRTRNLSGDNTANATRIPLGGTSSGSRSSLPLRADADADLHALRRTRSLVDVNEGEEEEDKTNQIDFRSAAFAAQALVPKESNEETSGPRNSTKRFITTSTGSRVIVVHSPGKPGSVRIKRDKQTGSITELHTSDENYLDADLDDSVPGGLTIKPRNGAPAKTFTVKPNVKNRSSSSGEPKSRQAISKGHGENPKSPSPPTLERMDTQAQGNLTNGGTPPGNRRVQLIKPKEPAATSTRAVDTASPRIDSRTPDNTTSPPALDHGDVPQEQGQDETSQPSPPIRTSGRSGRPIKRPYEDSAWAYGGEFDKLMGAEAPEGKHRARTPRRSDDVRPRRPSSKQRVVIEDSTVVDDMEFGEIRGVKAPEVPTPTDANEEDDADNGV